MRIIVCVDEKGGMSFGGRRQSRDRVVKDRILELTADANLWMNRDSAGQFETLENIHVLVLCGNAGPISLGRTDS